MTTTSEKALRQLGDAGSRLAVSVARDEHVLRRVEGDSREGSWVCSCGVGFPVSGDARDRAQIEHSAHLWTTVREACEAQGFTLSTAWMSGVKKAEADLASARTADEPIVASDPVEYSLVALRRLLRAAQSKLDRIIADSPNDHRAREVTSAQVRSLKLAVSTVEGSRKAVAASPTGADFLVVDGGPGMPKRTFKEVGSDVEAMTDRQLSNVLHGREADNNGEFTSSSMGAAQERLAHEASEVPRFVPTWAIADAIAGLKGTGGSTRIGLINLLQGVLEEPIIKLGTVMAENKGNALTDCGPDFRVVPVRVLQDALNLINAGLEGAMGPRLGKSLRIELGHLINERHA